jgi:hypothetical protein
MTRGEKAAATKMTEIKVSNGASSGQPSLMIGILLAGLALSNLNQGIARGHVSDPIVSAIMVLLSSYFFLDYYKYWSGRWIFAFDQDS